MKLISLRWCSLLLLALLLGGCAANSNREELFDSQTRAYGSTIRWGNYDVANAFRKQAEDTTRKQLAGLKKFHVTSYEVVGAHPSDDGNTMLLTVSIKYYRDDSMVERTLTDQQRWHYDAKDKRWLLLGPLPAFQ